ncbi:MAG: hypothetical protein OCC46_02770 [Pseudodesulfovibrio sp.]
MYLSITEQSKAMYSALLGSFQGEAQQNKTYSPLILSNGGSTTPPQEEEWFPVHACVYVKWEAAHKLPPFPYELSSNDKKQRPHAERDWVLGMLRDAVGLKGVKWESLGEKGYWRWKSALRRQIQKVDEIEDNSFKPDRELYFLACGSWRSMGGHIKYVDGSERLYSYNCSERGCPQCYDRDKQRTAKKLFKKIMAAAKALDIKRFWGIEITLQPIYESLPVVGSDLRKNINEAIQKFLRKLFGLKTRDGLFAYCSVHAVGKQNLFRDRFHFHCGVLPIAKRMRKGKYEIIHCDFEMFKADLDRARSLLADHLEQVLPDYDRSKTNIYLAPFLLKETKKDMGKLMHHLKYDLRGFGKDIEQAPICFNWEKELVVIKQGDLGYGTFTFRQMAERWKWIREQRGRLTTWGLLNRWNSNLELIGVEFVDDPEPEIVEENDITIIRSGGRQWNPKKKRVEWVNEKMAVDENGSVIFGIEWGRKGSEGFWQPVPKNNVLSLPANGNPQAPPGDDTKDNLGGRHV